MANIVGGLIGGAGSLFGSSSAKSNALTGYNYLAGKNGTPGPGSDYVNRGEAAGTAQSNLLGLNGAAGGAASSPAFGNYLNSTGYNFQRDQGTGAIAGSAAARGMLDSGGTLKAMGKYATNLAGTTFNNYLGQLSGISGQGLTAANAIGTAGTQGGETAAKAQAGGDSNFFGSMAKLAPLVFA